VSTPRSLDLPDQVRPVTIKTRRGAFAALEAEPTTGVCERRPALLIPGFTGSKEDFIPVLQPLASAGRRVVAMDMRGQYQSQGAPQASGYAPDELGADITAIAEAIASDRGGVHLVGHSLGGLVAREAALAQAARIISLTLLSSGPGRITGQRAAALRDLLALMAAADASGTTNPSGATDASGATDITGTTEPAGTTDTTKPSDGADAADSRLRATVEKIFREHLAPQAKAEGAPEHVIAFLHERMARSSPTGLMVMGRYLLTCPDRTAELASLDRPAILVLYGENDDAWRPAVQEQMARRLGAHRVCIPGAGHSPAVEAPETTASTLTAFWRTAEDSERRGNGEGVGTPPSRGQAAINPAAAHPR
jgi:pimeloyl-ACP methyl ester carboxylesterase